MTTQKMVAGDELKAGDYVGAHTWGGVALLTSAERIVEPEDGATYVLVKGHMCNDDFSIMEGVNYYGHVFDDEKVARFKI